MDIIITAYNIRESIGFDFYPNDITTERGSAGYNPIRELTQVPKAIKFGHAGYKIYEDAYF